MCRDFRFSLHRVPYRDEIDPPTEVETDSSGSESEEEGKGRLSTEGRIDGSNII